MTNDENLADNVTTLVLNRIKKEVDFSEVDPFTMKYLRREIHDILLKHMDWANERFTQAFEEGESKGFEAGMQEARERVRDFASDF